MKVLSPTRRPRRATTAARTLLAGSLAALLAVAALGATSSPAAAEEEGDGGWVRLTHLSPDTPEVNVSLTSLSDSTSVLELAEVGYGAVSDYAKVDAGTYVATMTPAGGDSSSEPAISQSVTVEDGRAYTVAAVGLNADLEGTVLTDDLETPGEDTAKIRLLQASNLAPTVTVTAEGGPTLAEDAEFATATGYAEVPSGVWSVTITPSEGDAEPVTTDVRAESASVSTVVVLDAEDGSGLEALVVNDASGVQEMPEEGTGVETGGGGTALQNSGGTALQNSGGTALQTTSAPAAGVLPAAVTGALALLALAGMALVARRAPGLRGGRQEHSRG